MSEEKTSEAAPATPASPRKEEGPVTRTVRTYKKRSMAEAAETMLREQGIEATILDLALTPGSKNVKPGAVRLVVDADQAAAATSLLLKYDRSNQPPPAAGEGVRSKRYRPLPKGPSVPGGLLSIFGGLGRRSGEPGRGITPGAVLFMLMAVASAGLGIFYFIKHRVARKIAKGTEASKIERLIYEDMNHDGVVDLRRYVTTNGLPIREEVDANFDGKWDVRLLFSEGRLVRRTVDVDGNGIYDEETYYGAEGQPVYGQLVLNGRGPVTKRTFFQDVLDFPDYEPPPDEGEDEEGKPSTGEFRQSRILLDTDGDGNFDVDRQLNSKGETLSESKLEKGAPENAPPAMPAS